MVKKNSRNGRVDRNGLRTFQNLSADSRSVEDGFVQLSQTGRMRALFPALSRTSCDREQSTVLLVCALLWLVL